MNGDRWLWLHTHRRRRSANQTNAAKYIYLYAQFVEAHKVIKQAFNRIVQSQSKSVGCRCPVQVLHATLIFEKRYCEWPLGECNAMQIYWKMIITIIIII